MSLGEKILNLRKKKGLSQEQLGEKINVTRQTISNWELNETAPSVNELKLLSKEFNISIDELVDNDIKDIVVEKVSNTEKLSGLILKLLKIIIIGTISLFLLLLIGSIIYKNVRKSNSGRLMEESIVCELYGEEHSYSISFEEYTGLAVAEGGDSYFYDILGLEKYNDVHQIFNIINDYVKKNGGTCTKIANEDLNDLIDFYVKEGTLTKESATVVLKKNVDYEVVFGEEFYIEKYNYKTSSWENVKDNCDNCAFNLIAYNLEKDKPFELKQDWSHMYGSLDKGLYRIVKNVNFDSQDYKKYHISAEFSIE